jgi:hypothetical protein
MPMLERCAFEVADHYPCTRTIVVETEVRGDDGKLAAKVLQTQAIL